LNKVKAIEVWAKAEKKDAELQNMIAEQKIRTQRILGQLLKESDLAKAAKGNQYTGKLEQSDDTTSPTLKSFGITKDQSSTFQKIAALPEEIFEAEIATAKNESAKRVELTTSRVLLAAKEYEQQKKKDEKIQERESTIENIVSTAKYNFAIDNLQHGWYKVNNQFLYFGSNTDKDFIDFLPKAKFVFADPPYNAGVDEWDYNFKWELDYLQDKADVVAVTPGGWNACNFYKETQMNYIWEMFCWISNGMTHGKCGYANVIKTSIFGNVKPKISQDFWKISIRVSETEDTQHKGRKPYEFMFHLLDVFTKESDIVIDPFAGSGTTLIMCEQMNRISYNAEINEQYCRLIFERSGNAVKI
jgi:16S rRNA G966 N2-methylase RsmD